ncbi:hypothetical protein CJO71_19960 [Burkholderia ubonensis]|uniref:Uncharacterized protein n=1 Tax=Burkholderia ubonensis TaxID=101571 RepID=A0AB74D029_9BURK|nr:hypothetical protein [Burkholderia ubonensis]PAJ79155.1 hypothetical protein CJO71_19960 [Burkholderia ubonensis]PAJ98883.1 hypothetical protein CJO68_22735 [Burkholderia ubonensis]RQP70008.1 hypothetical protein DF015_31140 [Burkholderia ubonensis]RQP85415.1 hypothetical protein DF012_32150 [Burkholderia ubonensis]
MTRIRERNLDDKVVTIIVEVLDGWNGRLTWEALIEAVEKREGLRYTRQTLHRHERIRLAFTVRKRALSGQSAESRAVASPELQVALERIARLEAENQRLAAENNALLEQFARWAYNAQTRNLTEDFLNHPLPAVDRQRSKPLHAVAKRTAASKNRR